LYPLIHQLEHIVREKNERKPEHSRRVSAKKTKAEQLIVVLLEPLIPGEDFINWVLHITIVPWFGVESDQEPNLDKLLSAIANRHSAIDLTVGNLEVFGKLTVNLINPSSGLVALHNDVLTTLENNQFIINQKTYTGTNYRAHVTHQKHASKKSGDKLRITKFALIAQTYRTDTGLVTKRLIREYPMQ
jgi:hypothetical protein